MAIKIGIAPDSWGVWFPASDPNNAKQPQWWRCLDEMKVAGYEGCEIGPWGYMPNDDPKVLKNAMDARGLTLVGATEGGNFLDDAAVEGMLKDIDDISKLLKAFPSAKYIVLLPPMYTNLATGELEMNPELTDEEWATYCKNVQKCADRCAANGFIGLFHPHVDSHVQTEEQIERFLNDTNVDLCFVTMYTAAASRFPSTRSGRSAFRTSTSRTAIWQSRLRWTKTSGLLPRLLPRISWLSRARAASTSLQCIRHSTSAATTAGAS